MLTALTHFSIIPNIHPILVHFTISLITISFIFNVVYYFARKYDFQNNLINEIEIVGRWCLWLALFFSTLTVLAGIYAYYTVPHDEAGHAAMGVHKNSAIITFLLIIIANVFYIRQYKNHKRINIVLLGLLAITQLSTLVTGYLGAEVVYRYGIGVIRAQTADMMIGHKHHHHDSNETEDHSKHDMTDMDMSKMDMSNKSDAEHTEDHPNNHDSHDMAGMNMEHENHTEDKGGVSKVDANNKVPLYWIDPMEPTVHYPKPGKSAMGMELVPVYPKPQTNLKNTITIPQSYVDNLGVALAPVKSNSLNNSINTYATIESDETKIAYVTFYANGWLRNLVVKSSGAQVKKGQLLAQIYSPTIINAEQEYLMALQSENKMLADAALKKLSSLHVSEIQISELTKSKKPSQLINIYAPQSGIISDLSIRQGDYITPETKLFNIVDLSSVWLIASVFEKQSSWVKVSNAAIARFAAYPDKSWKGTVDYVYPQIDSQTRSIRVRLRFDNPGLLLKPNMYGSIIIATSSKLGSMSIPSQALIRDENGVRVIVALGSGLFQVRKVTIGEENNGQIEILSGLNIGESVVKSGEFMLDSEANLSSALDRLDSAESTNSPATSTDSMKGMSNHD